MKPFRPLSPLFLSALLFLAMGIHPLHATEDPSGRSPRLMVHLLDYLAVDYAGAVKNGKILSETEYKEQTEFSKTVLELSQELPEMKSQPEIQSLVQELDSLIATKTDPGKVSELARVIQARVMAVAGFATAPVQWPDLAAGKKLFENTCAKCHGLEGRGDGPSAKGLKPPPANYHDPKMAGLSPLQAFNTVRLGVPGTPMAAFTSYSDQETWNLAFYVLSLRDKAALTGRDPDRLFHMAQVELNLNQDKLLTLLATQSDNALLPRLHGGLDEKSGKLSALRNRTMVESVKASLEFARFNMEDAFTAYQAHQREKAGQKALQAYLEGVEPVEPRLRADDPAAVADLEQAMASARSAFRSGQTDEEVQKAYQTAMEALSRATALVHEQAPSPGSPSLWPSASCCGRASRRYS